MIPSVGEVVVHLLMGTKGWGVRLKSPDNNKSFRQATVFISLPLMLLVPPLLGWLIGSHLDEIWKSSPWMTLLLVILGFVAGFREVWQMLKRFGDDF
jgi:ATP synthase protein I